MSESASDLLTIDELAQRTGLTTRNIRAYQSRGLVPHPVKQGRTGYYGPEHIERLELIRELREEGLALDLIQRIMEVSGGAFGGLSFARTLLSQYNETPRPEPAAYSLPELAERWGTDDFELVKRAEQAGVMRELDDGRVEIADAQLDDVGQMLRDLGMPAREMLDVLIDLRAKMRAIAERFRDIFNDYVWDPFESDGMPADRWDAVAHDLERLRPIADEVTLLLYRRAIEAVMDEALENKLLRLERESGRS